MKISSKQMQMAVNRIRSQLLEYSKQDQDLVIDISVTQENPGSGMLVDCVTVSGSAVQDDPSNKEPYEHTLSIELYEENTKQEPRAVYTKTFKVTKAY